MLNRGRIYSLALLAISAFGLGACTTAPTTPTIEIDERIAWSAPPVVKVSGLLPERPYAVVFEQASRRSADVAWVSTSTYTSDAEGVIDTRVSPIDVEKSLRPYAPFWRMDIREKSTSLAIDELRIGVFDSEDHLIAEHIVGFGADIDTLFTEDFEDAFPGAFIMRKAGKSNPLPAIVVLGGSEGGSTSARAHAPTLAAEGFIVLGLPYYSPVRSHGRAEIPQLPSAFAELPIDYLEAATAALRRRPDVDEDHILLLGGSKGAELALLAGALIPNSSDGGGFCGIVADVPSDVVWEGWGRENNAEKYSGFSWRGEPLPFVPYVDLSRSLKERRNGGDYTMTDAHENGRIKFQDSVALARIRVEDINEPVLVIGGDKDIVWASGKMSRSIVNKRDQAGLITESYIYPDLGHGAGGNPLTSSSELMLRARLENFPAIIAFLKRNAKRDDCRN